MTQMPPLNGPIQSNTVYVSDSTRQQLQKIGWKDGDPIPPDLGAKIKEALAALPPAPRPATTGTKLQAPVPVDIESLPAHARAELEASLRAYKERLQAAEEDAPPAHIRANPSLLAAYTSGKAAERAAASTPPQLVMAGQLGPRAGINGPAVSADGVVRPPVRQPAQTAVSAPAEISPEALLSSSEPSSFNQGHVSPAPPLAATQTATLAGSTDTPQTEQETAGGMANPIVTHCPRCQWDMSQKYDVVVTDYDKQLFRLSFFGPRFTKTYAVLGGSVQVTLRQLTSIESDMVFAQVSYDERANPGMSTGEWLSKMADYRIAAQLVSVSQDGRTLIENPAISDTDYDMSTYKSPCTPLLPAREFVYTHMLKSESLRRIVVRQYQQFQRLVEALEAMAEAPDFF